MNYFFGSGASAPQKAKKSQKQDEDKASLPNMTFCTPFFAIIRT